MAVEAAPLGAPTVSLYTQAQKKVRRGQHNPRNAAPRQRARGARRRDSPPRRGADRPGAPRRPAPRQGGGRWREGGGGGGAGGRTGSQGGEQISQGLARAATAAKVSGEIWDLSRPINQDATVEILKEDGPDALYVLRHSSAHALATAVRQL